MIISQKQKRKREEIDLEASVERKYSLTKEASETIQVFRLSYGQG